MDRFLSLTLDESCKTPRIASIIAQIKESHNEAFFTMGNWLNSAKGINQKYTLVAIKDVIDLSPLGNNNPITPEKLNPVVSFKWLYLIYAISCRKVSDDQELEDAKNNYIFTKIFEFLKNVDLNVEYSCEFTSAVIVLAARFLQNYKMDIKGIVDDQIYEIILRIFNSEYKAGPAIQLASFPNSGMISFLSPLQLEALNKQNLYQNINLMIKAAIVRFLLKTIPLVFPQSSNSSLKNVVQSLCHDGPIVDQALTLLIMLFNGNTIEAFKYKDQIRYQSLTEKIILQYNSSNSFKTQIKYKMAIDLSHDIITIQEIAQEHPDVWEIFLKENPNLQKALEGLLFSDYDDQLIVSSAALLCLGHAHVEDVESVSRIFFSTAIQKLRSEMKQLLLLQPDKSSQILCKHFKDASNHGSQSSDFFDLLSELIKSTSNPSLLLRALFSSIKVELAQLRMHPNSYIYTELQKYIDLSASYLDEQPCNVCNNPERIPQMQGMREFIDGQKFTSNEIYMKFKHPMIIHKFKLSYGIKKSDKFPHIVKLFINADKITDANKLINQNREWRYLADMTLSKNEKSASVNLPLPVTATCLKILFTDIQEETRVPRCLRCHSEVDPKTGRCTVCGENAFHCRNCSEYNPNDPNGFICPSCGNSNFLEMSWQLTAIKTFSHTRISSDDDLQLSLTFVDNLMVKVHNTLQKISEYKSRIEELVSPTTEMSVNDRTGELRNIYNDKCRKLFQELTEYVQHINAIRSSIAKYLQITNSFGEEPENMCYNCKQKYIINGLTVIGKIEEIPQSEIDEAFKLLITFADVKEFSSAAIGSLLSFCKVKESLTDKIINMFLASLPNPSPHLANLLIQILDIDDKHKIKRFEQLTNVLVESMKCVSQNSGLMTVVVVPLARSLMKSKILIRSGRHLLLSKYYFAWRNKELLEMDAFQAFSEDLLKGLLFSTNSKVRVDVSDLLFDTSLISESHYSRVLSFVRSVFINLETIKKENEQCLTLLSKLIQSNAMHNHTIVSDIIDSLIAKLESESFMTFKNESSLTLDLSAGYNFSSIAQIIKGFVNNPIDLRFIAARKPKLVESLTKSYFYIKSLVIQRSKYIEDAASILKETMLLLLKPTFEINKDTEDEDFNVIIDNIEAPKIVIKAISQCIKLSTSRVIRELNELMFPKHKAREFSIILQKIRSQEQYIPGPITLPAFSNNAIGPTMLDIKKKVCEDTNMPDLMQDERSLELLVNGNIIALNLNIEDVYTNVWEPNQGPNKPMTVIFRLQGLDGLAQEPMITHFRQNNDEELNPEIKFSYSIVLARENLFDNFVNAIPKCPTLACQVLNAFCSIEENKKCVIKLNPLDYIFDSLKLLLSDTENSYQKIEPVTQLASTLINYDANADANADDHIQYVLSALEIDAVKKNENLQSQLLAFLPPLASKRRSLTKRVLEFFIGGLRPKDVPEGFNFYSNCTNIYLLNSFAEFVNSLPNDDNSLRETISHNSFVPDAIKYIEECFIYEAGPKSKEWERAVDKEAVPAALKTLAGMVSAEVLQKHLVEDNCKFMKLILELCNVASTRNIGELAENIIKGLANTSAADELNKLVEAENEIKKQQKNEMRQKLVEQSEQQMQGQIESLLDMLGDDSEIACCICKDGYDYLPDEPLGMYAFLSRDNHTATHFVYVHQKCHNSELRTNQHRNNEWQLASVRNCESQCNCIFPLPMPSETIENYGLRINKFFGRNRPGDILRMILEDILFHVEVVSTGSCINFKMGGGSAPNDIKFIPLLIYCALAQNAISREKFNQVLKNVSPKLDLAYSLCTMDIEEWRQNKLQKLTQIIKQATNGVAADQKFATAKSAFVMFLIFNEANEMIKKTSKDKWATDLSERITNQLQDVLSEWQDLADKVQDEFLELADVKTALIYSGIELDNPQSWFESL